MTKKGLSVIYHWWSVAPLKVWEDQRYPVIHAIATLRGQNRDVRVYVLDVSDHPNDWGQFPRALDFEVVKTEWRVPGLAQTVDPGLYRLCTRAFVVPRFAADLDTRVVLFADADIFWLRDPLPLLGDTRRFCCCPRNTGVFYYEPDSVPARRFLLAWQRTLWGMLTDPDSKARIMACYPVRCMNDEAAYCYLTSRRSPLVADCVDFVPVWENFHVRQQFDPRAKNCHFLFFAAGRSRGRFATAVREFRDAVCRALPPDMVALLRGGDEAPPIPAKFMGEILPHARRRLMDSLRMV